ncbi:MAG: hypothetical protein ACREMY_24810, partial [bacterium]
ILARAAGAVLDRDEVEVEPLVPAPAPGEDVAAFLARLRGAKTFRAGDNKGRRRGGDQRNGRARGSARDESC